MTANKIFFVSLGCDKNRIDSEEMLGYLSGAGFSFTYDETEADIIIINTCAFIDPAKEESIETILEMSEYKNSGKCRKLIVTGCLSERYADQIMKEMPEIDAVLGTNENEKIVNVVRSALSDDTSAVTDEKYKAERILTTGGHYSFIKIAEGCSNHCTYCVIPSIRGPYRSFPVEDILKEAESLARKGVKELNIVAQETTVYGRDLYGKDMLPDLLKKLCLIDGFEWIRLLYAYPENITGELLEVIASEDKLCDYIDMPIQHCSDRILKRMGRRIDKAGLIKKIELCRKIVPDIALRTSLITGFPSETEEEHRELLDFVRKIKFDRLGVFTYSQEEGTPAAGFEGQIPDEEKSRRQAELMALQKEVSAEKLLSCIGREFDVFIEGRLIDEDVYIGRTYMDAPDVDGCFFVKSVRELMSGDIIKAKVTDASEYDMTGMIVNESGK